MALERDASPVPFSWLFRDNNYKDASVGLYLPAGIVTGGIDTWAAGTRAELLALTNARLIGANASYVYNETVETVAPPEAEVERKLVLVFGTALRGVNVSMEIPSPVFGLESPNTDEVSIDNPLVSAFAAAVINGALGPGNGPVSRTGIPIESIERAYFSHRYRKPRR